MKLWKDIYQYALAALIVLSFVAIVILVIITGSQDNAVMNTLTGALAAIVVMVAGYFFGSSKGSAEKNDIIANGKK